jgi:hypothetical protein
MLAGLLLYDYERYEGGRRRIRYGRFRTVQLGVVVCVVCKEPLFLRVYLRIKKHYRTKKMKTHLKLNYERQHEKTEYNERFITIKFVGRTMNTMGVHRPKNFYFRLMNIRATDEYVIAYSLLPGILFTVVTRP